MMERNARSHEKKMTVTFAKKFDASNINLNEWIIIKELGSG